jgi:integrase
MASIWRRKDTKRYPFWYACYTDANGRRIKKSTGLTSKSSALRMAHKLEDAVKLAKQRLLTENKAREIISEIVASVHGGEGLRSYTVRAWFEHFSKIKQKSRDHDTAVKYEQIKREFLTFLGPKADLNILAISGADVRAFRDRREHELSASTLNDHLTFLSSYFNGAWRANVISNNPCTEVEPAKDDLSPARRQKQPFTIEQVVALLKAANDDWRGLIKLAFYTGARLENCVRLRFRDLDYSATPPVIVFERYSKHGDEHRVPMHPALEEHFLSLAAPEKDDDDAFVFPSLALNSTGKPRHVANLSKQFRELMQAAHIKNSKLREGAKGKGKSAARTVMSLGFHSFRRTHISELANAGVSEERRMAITAHANREVHKGYTHLGLEQLHKDIAQSLPTL